MPSGGAERHQRARLSVSALHLPASDADWTLRQQVKKLGMEGYELHGLYGSELHGYCNVGEAIAMSYYLQQLNSMMLDN